MNLPRIGIHVVVIKKALNLKVYLDIQKVDAIGSELNRNGTREEHKCDDVELLRHPEWLIQHYIDYGGARWAADKFRDKLYIDVEIPLHIYIAEQLRSWMKYIRNSLLGKKINKTWELVEFNVVYVMHNRHAFPVIESVRRILS
jgi:hypothetical protein